MRTGGGIAVLLGTMLFVSHAVAEENATNSVAIKAPSVTGETAPRSAKPGILDRLFTLGDVALGLLSRLVDEKRAEFDRAAERYTRLVEFTKRLEARDEADFEARAERYERLRALTCKLEAEQAEREARDFAAQVDLVVRELAFTRELERRRAVSTLPIDTPATSDHTPLYERK